MSTVKLGAYAAVQRQGPLSVSEPDQLVVLLEHVDVGGWSGSGPMFALGEESLASPPMAPDLAPESDTGASNTDNLTRDRTPTLTGVGPVGAVIRIYEAGILVASAVADDNGLWSVTLPEQTEGAHSYVATAETDGEESGVSSELHVTIDTTPPPAPSVPDLDAGSDSGSSATDNLTNDTTPTLTGTGPANTLIRIYEGDTLVAEGVSDGSGAWSITLPPQSEGTHRYHARSVDLAGNEGALVSYVRGAGGSDSQVNTGNPYQQDGGRITPLSDGGYVVVWASLNQDGDSYGVFGRIFNADGTPRTDDVLLNVTTAGSQTLPAVTAVAGGGFAVVWTDSALDGSGSGIVVRVFDDQGVGGTASVVNTVTAGAQTLPSITTLADGDLLVTWQSADRDGDGAGIAARRLNPNGTPDGAEFVVNTTNIAGAQTSPVVAALADGGYVVTWVSAHASPTVVMSQRYDAAGVAQGEAQANQSAEAASEPAVVGLTGGGYVVVWTSASDGSNTGVYARMYDADGDAVGDEFRVNSWTSGAQTDAAIIALPDGGFMVSWVSVGQDGHSFGIAVQQFDAQGGRVGNEFIGNQVTVNWQFQPDLALLENGTLVLSFTGSGSSIYEIFQRRFVGGTVFEDITVTIDTTPPSLTFELNPASDNGSDSSDNITSNRFPTFQGHTEAWARVDILVNDVVVGTVQANGAGAWSWTSPSLEPGTHAFVARATDAAGNSSEQAYELTIVPSVPAPSLPDLDAASDSGASDSDDLTNDVTPTLTGTGPANTLIRIYEGNTLVASSTSDGDGNWSITLPVQSEGAHTYQARAVDEAGNEATLAGFYSEIVVQDAASGRPLLALLDDGGYVATWTIGDGASRQVVVQAYDADGSPRGDLFIAAQGNGVSAAGVIDLVGGGFLVAVADGSAGRAISFDGAGQLVPGSEVYIYGEPVGVFRVPGGTIVVVSNSDPSLTTFNPDGTWTEEEYGYAETAYHVFQGPPAVTAYGGGYIIAHPAAGVAFYGAPVEYSVRVQFWFTPMGYTPVPFAVATGSSPFSHVDVAAGLDGGFAVLFRDTEGVATLNLYDDNLQLLSTWSSDALPGDAQIFALQGGYILTYAADGDALGQMFGTDGQPLGPAVVLRDGDGSATHSPSSVIQLADGSLLIGWLSNTGAGGSDEVVLSRVALTAGLTVTIDTTGPDVSVNTLAGDGQLSVAEIAAGALTVTGTVSDVHAVSISIELNGQTYAATVTGGVWSVVIPQAHLQALEAIIAESFSLRVTATDAAGNVTTDTHELVMAGVRVGSDGAQTFVGGDEVNRFYGRPGDDILQGGGGDDRLYGNTGDDLLIGGAGADVIDGGAGIDTASYAGSSAGVIVRLGQVGIGGDAEGDTLTSIENLIGSDHDDELGGDSRVNRLEGGAGDDLLNGRGGADQLIGGLGTDTATYVNSTAGVTARLDGGANTGGEAEGDVFDSIENLIGSAFNDILIGSADANRLNGGAGDDLLIGGAGADVLEGGAGNDTASYAGSSAGVLVRLGQVGTGGDAEGDTYSSIENLIGSDFNDELRGDALANRLEGGSGDDLLNGRGGADLLIGGAGSDTATYVNSTAGVTVRLDGGASTGGEAEGDTFDSIENLIGSGYNDTLIGSAEANRLNGGAGDDLLIGGAGADVLEGGVGSDTASYAGSSAGVIVRLGQVGIGGDAEGDTLISIENLIGSDHDDELGGDSKVNRLEGGTGNDVLNGRGGADLLIGGAGSDTATYVNSTAGVTARLDGGANTGGEAEGDVFDSIENLIGSAFNDTLIGSAEANRLSGGAGDDLLIGGAGADVLEGGVGNDTASYAGSSARVIVRLGQVGIGGDAEGDTLTSIENLIGSNHDDFLGGDSKVNRLDGGTGDDVLNGRGGADLLIGGAGSDTATYVNSTTGVTARLDGGANTGGEAEGDVFDSIENLIGSAFNDTLIGSAEGNRLDGGAGDDVLEGGDGDDILVGGSGADLLIGGAGDDVLTGGSGADRFDFRSGGGRDVITDFAAGAAVSDVILLSSLVFTDFADVLAHTADDGMGNTVIAKGAVHITLSGVLKAQLRANDFDIALPALLLDAEVGSKGLAWVLPDMMSAKEIIDSPLVLPDDFGSKATPSDPVICDTGAGLSEHVPMAFVAGGEPLLFERGPGQMMSQPAWVDWVW